MTKRVQPITFGNIPPDEPEIKEKEEELSLKSLFYDVMKKKEEDGAFSHGILNLGKKVDWFQPYDIGKANILYVKLFECIKLSQELLFEKDIRKLPPLIQILTNDNSFEVQEKLIKNYPNISLNTPYEKLPPLLKLLYHAQQSEDNGQFILSLIKNLELDTPYEKLPPNLKMLVDLQIDQSSNSSILYSLCTMATHGKLKNWKLVPEESKEKEQVFQIELSKPANAQKMSDTLLGYAGWSFPKTAKIKFNKEDKTIEFLSNPPKVKASFLIGDFYEIATLNKISVTNNGLLKFEPKVDQSIDWALKLFNLKVDDAFIPYPITKIEENFKLFTWE